MMAAVCFTSAAAMLAMSIAPAIDPRLTAAEMSCTFWYCAVEIEPMRLLADAAGAIPLEANGQRLEEALSAPLGRSLFAVAGFAASLPWALMFLYLGLGFRAARKRAGLDAAATRLRRAALAALAGACLAPVATTLRATAMTPALPGGQQLFIWFDASGVFWGLLIAGTAYVAIWVIEQALAAQRQLAAII
jgi:hypothetical protein